jgi:hypothetical protein
MSFFIFPVTIKIDFLQKEKLKEQFGDVKSAIEHGSAYRVLRSVFPTAPRPKLSEQVKLIQRNFFCISLKQDFVLQGLCLILSCPLHLTRTALVLLLTMICN